MLDQSSTLPYTNIGFNSLGMQVCVGGDKNFVVINQKGIDPPSLDLLARAGVIYSFFFFLVVPRIQIIYLKFILTLSSFRFNNMGLMKFTVELGAGWLNHSVSYASKQSSKVKINKSPLLM